MLLIQRAETTGEPLRRSVQWEQFTDGEGLHNLHCLMCMSIILVNLCGCSWRKQQRPFFQAFSVIKYCILI
jgi:hypothetical protein